MTAVQAILPQHLLSRLVGKLAQLEKPVWLKNFLIRTFMSRYDIDLTEATCSSGEDFPHFNAFFTRSLREGCLLYTSPSPRDRQKSRMPSSA